MAGIEATCSQESNAAFLYIQDEDEPEVPEHREDDIARGIPLRSKVLRSKDLEFLVDRTMRLDESSPLHRMMLTHGDRPVYVRAVHMVRDFWWAEIEVKLSTAGQDESCAPDYGTVQHIAYLKGGGQRIRQQGPVRWMRNQPGGTGLMAARWTQAALTGPTGRTSKEMTWPSRKHDPRLPTHDY